MPWFMSFCRGRRRLHASYSFRRPSLLGANTVSSIRQLPATLAQVKFGGAAIQPHPLPPSPPMAAAAPMVAEKFHATLPGRRRRCCGDPGASQQHPAPIPPRTEASEREMLREVNDGHLVLLLDDVTQSVNELRCLGKKFHVVEHSRSRKQMCDRSSMMSVITDVASSGSAWAISRCGGREFGGINFLHCIWAAFIVPFLTHPTTSHVRWAPRGLRCAPTPPHNLSDSPQVKS